MFHGMFVFKEFSTSINLNAYGYVQSYINNINIDGYNYFGIRSFGTDENHCIPFGISLADGRAYYSVKNIDSSEHKNVTLLVRVCYVKAPVTQKT